VRSIGLFGSYAKNNFNETSDIDILVDLKEQKYDSWVSLKLFLEKAWNKHVDIITAGSHLRKQFLDTIS
jgi:predicted nucleotidyltransferase